MVVSIKELPAGEHLELVFIETYIIPPAYNVSAPEVTAAFEGRLVDRLDHYALLGKIKAELEMSCACCLKDIRYTAEAEVCETFRRLDNEDGEHFSFQGDSIDLRPALEMNLLLNIPYKVLCAEDCKGLCPVCGTNLNTEPCECGKADADPRLAVLHTLFPQTE